MKKTKMLKKNYEFSNIFSKGKYYSGKTIEAFILNNNEQPKNKEKLNYLGLAISVKSGHAYQRNRVKRLLRENYRFLEENMQSGYSLVFLWKKKCDISNASFQQIRKDMIEICEKANIIVKRD